MCNLLLQVLIASCTGGVQPSLDERTMRSLKALQTRRKVGRSSVWANLTSSSGGRLNVTDKTSPYIYSRPTQLVCVARCNGRLRGFLGVVEFDDFVHNLVSREGDVKHADFVSNVNGEFFRFIGQFRCRVCWREETPIGQSSGHQLKTPAVV